jgi:hypothetical protein
VSNQGSIIDQRSDTFGDSDTKADVAPQIDQKTSQNGSNAQTKDVLS